MSHSNLFRLVAYCGLYCGLCAQRGRIPELALQLQQTLQEEGLDDFYQYFPKMKEVFPQFLDFLQNLANFDCTCRTKTDRSSDCKIRKCAVQRNVTVCPQCEEYPCQHIQTLAERYPTLIQDGKRLQKMGVERWISEQEERRRRGVVYSDLKSKQMFSR